MAFDLEILAVKESEKFYALPEEQRRRCIVVEGGNLNMRDEFAQSLRKYIPNNFVMTQEQFIDYRDQYCINIDDVTKNLKAS